MKQTNTNCNKKQCQAKYSGLFFYPAAIIVLIPIIYFFTEQYTRNSTPYLEQKKEFSDSVIQFIQKEISIPMVF